MLVSVALFIVNPTLHGISRSICNQIGATFPEILKQDLRFIIRFSLGHERLGQPFSAAAPWACLQSSP